MPGEVPGVVPGMGPGTGAVPRTVPVQRAVHREVPGTQHGTLPRMVPRAMPGAMPWSIPSAMTGTMPGTIPGIMPGAMPGIMPGAMPRTLPGAMIGTMPGAMPSAMPNAMTGTMPGAMPMSLPGAMPRTMLSAMPGTMPGAMAGTTPGTMPGTRPGAMPGAMPGTMPGAMPGTTPGTMPGAMPGTMPGTTPGAMPGAMPGTTPGAMPGTMPVAVPGQAPGTVREFCQEYGCEDTRAGTSTFRRTVSETITQATPGPPHDLFQHPVCEVCSSFYTSNPLMYISRYSEITVTSGYELDTGPGAGTPVAMLGGQQLSGRRELVEQLDSEPLFDYLVQNGALEPHMVAELRKEKSAVKVNLALLRHVEANGKPALNLFVNALRQTGQHHLASLLDDSQRIRALSGSGYLSQKRHKGQISLQVNVRALRLPPEELAALKGPQQTPRLTASLRGALSSRDWVSQDEVRYRIVELTEPKALPSTPQFEVIDPVEEDTKHRSCLCLCFSRMFSRRKGHPENQKVPYSNGHPNQKTAQQNGNQQNGYKNSGVSVKYVPNKVHQVAPSSTSHISGEGSKDEKQSEDPANVEELKKLRNLESRFSSKAQELFAAMKGEPGLTAHLAKYFEQDRGILVLETNFERGLVIVSICMKVEQVEQLRRDYSNGRLNADMQTCLVTQAVLDKVCVKGVKLHTDINQDEFEQAEQELK